MRSKEACDEKQEKKTNNLILYLNELEKINKTKLQVNLRKGINNIRTEIHEIEIKIKQ